MRANPAAGPAPLAAAGCPFHNEAQSRHTLGWLSRESACTSRRTRSASGVTALGSPLARTKKGTILIAYCAPSSRWRAWKTEPIAPCPSFRSNTNSDVSRDCSPSDLKPKTGRSTDGLRAEGPPPAMACWTMSLRTAVPPC
eukprot:scaffold30856_cov96-Isochrysis_galbana.AAC.1